MLAATAQGDAAFTIDDRGNARLWPVLDGTREPVAIPAMPAVDAALTKHGDGFVAGILDGSGGVALLRLDREGRVIGRSVIGPDPGFDELDAYDGGVLALRRDQVLVQFAADGTERATLAANAGERITSVVVRGTHVVVGLERSEVVDQLPAPQPATGGGRSAVDLARTRARAAAGPERRIDSVRTVTATRGLAWGPLRALPAVMTGQLALTPSGTRLAGRTLAELKVVIVDLTGDEQREATTTVFETFPAETFVGFLDDTTLLAVSGTLVRWWKAQKAKDPWLTPNLDVQGSADTIAIADGIAIGARGMMLQLVDHQRTRFLGYRQLANRVPASTTTGIAIATDKRVAWLDSALRVQSVRAPLVTHNTTLLPIGDQHVLHLERSSTSTTTIYLYGGAAQPPILLGSWAGVGTVAYDRRTRVLAIPAWSQPGTPLVIRRFELDLVAHTTKRLRPLASDKLDNVFVHDVQPLDPDLANGAILTAFATSLGDKLVFEFSSDASQPEASDVPIAGTSRRVTGDLRILGIDQHGTTFFMMPTARRLTMLPVREAQVHVPMPETLELEDMSGGGVSEDGQLISLFGRDRVISIDRKGTVLWELAPWMSNGMQFVDEGRGVAFGSRAGVTVVDRATGKRTATVCGLTFELTTDAPNLETFGGDNACTLDE